MVRDEPPLFGPRGRAATRARGMKPAREADHAHLAVQHSITSSRLKVLTLAFIVCVATALAAASQALTEPAMFDSILAHVNVMLMHLRVECLMLFFVNLRMTCNVKNNALQSHPPRRI